MINTGLEQELLGSERLQVLLRSLASQGVSRDLAAIEPEGVAEAIDWNFALFCCSALTGSRSERGQAAVLRIAQGCLLDGASDHFREAAAVLLERLGNRPALELAVRRNYIEANAWTMAPAPVQLDVIRRRLELTISANGHSQIQANVFQRDFWRAATEARWVSMSAPTSAGKSYIVKRWLESEAAGKPRFRGVYLVPTRALIEEVSGDLRGDFGAKAAIHTLPWDADIGLSPIEIHVLTQERLHLLQQRFPGFVADVLFIDEAQKFGDGSRGVLLQQVIDEAVSRSPYAQVIFASPLTENPELLLQGAPVGVESRALKSGMVTVNQNLLWVNQVPGRPREWRATLVDGEATTEVGRFELPARPQPASKRLPQVAVALGRGSSGNVVYVDGPAAAEKAALQIHEALGPDADIADDDEIVALKELIAKAVHPQYLLNTVVSRGVAFHYGNMPLLLKAEIERLFRDEKLRYLVCTSTLLEGVNLPCQNIFARGPRKGQRKVMSSFDFWNLAGRAGRWGKEFEGNIVCVDTVVEKLWPTPPTRRVHQKLHRATDDVLNDVGSLISCIESRRKDDPQERPSDRDRLTESVFSLYVGLRCYCWGLIGCCSSFWVRA